MEPEISKKIGIVTVVGYDNYGNLLQNYAVNKLLENLGYQPVTLNNHITEAEPLWNKESTWNKIKPDYLKKYLYVKLNQVMGCKNSSDFVVQNMIKLFVNRKKFQKSKEKRYEKFKLFRNNYIPYEPVPICNQKFSESDYFAFVCGSDIIWYPRYHNDKSFDFLCFTPEYKRIALAPSFGVSEIPEIRKNAYKDWLTGIQYLSVRETTGAEIIEDLIHKKAEVLPDPTLSIGAEHWRSIAKIPEKIPSGEYILCYFLGNISSEYVSWIKKCADLKGRKVIYMWEANFLEYYTADPCEFLWLVDHASAVFTDSFHGVVFSILFHTPIVAFRRIEEGLSIFSRIESLLCCMSMEQREFGKVEINQYDKMDYSETDGKIAVLRKKETAFLERAFNKIKGEYGDEQKQSVYKRKFTAKDNKTFKDR